MTIPRRILLQVAAGASLVIAVSTAVTYGIVYNNAANRGLQHLETYVAERSRREEIGFQQVAINLSLVRGQFLKRMEGPVPQNLQEKWNERFRLFPDGAWRSREEFADGRKHSTLFAHKNATLTPEFQTKILGAQDICNELLPGWVDAFPSLYFVFPGWANIGFDPRIPSWVWDTPGDYDASTLEWFQLALPENPPALGSLWTGVIEEPTTKMPVVSVYIPIYKDGEFLGSIGHDLSVESLMDETTRSGLFGARHLIFRADGRLVAHPTKQKEILAKKGHLRMQESGEPELASLYQAVTARKERAFSGYDPGSESYFSVARLAGPDWFFLTTIARHELRRQAFQSARWVLWSGLVSLAFVLTTLAVILKRQIAQPLLELTRATRQMSAGDLSATAVVKRKDELGLLAASFNEMASRVASREAELRAEKATLERRVAERTAELARFASIAEATGDFFGFANMNERILYINPAGRRLIGLAPEANVQALSIRDVHPRAAYEELRDVSFPTGLREGACAGETRLLHRDGREITVSLMLVIPRTTDGEPMFISAIMRDITARKEAEAKLLASEQLLRESEARFVTAFRSSPAMQSIIRAGDRVLVEVNDTFLNKLGFIREQVIGKAAHELNFWVDPNELKGFAQEVESKGFVVGREVRLRGRDGRELTVLLSTQPVDIGGAPHFLSAGVDITARKEAEAKLLESERQLREGEARIRALYETVSAAVVVQDESGFIQINSASLKLFGAERPEEVMGRHPSDFSPPRQPNGEESAIAARRHMERAKLHGTERFEWLARRLNGTELPVEVTLTALKLEGRPVLQAVIIDLTERKRAEAELQNALDKERELSQLRSEFVSLVSHEFRTPLEIIMSSADNLDRYHDRLQAEKRQQLLRTINKSVRRMSGMMEEVLVLGRFESNRISFNPVQVDLRSLCQRVSDEIASATGGRCPIRLQMQEMATDAFGDESLLRHIFTNLLSNAVKDSEPEQTVEFVVHREDGNAVCRITDRGCGIPEADQRRLFQAFHRGSNVRQTPGTGLGLLIVKRCVDMHGGRISFESVEGEGTTFVVTLPLFVSTFDSTLARP